nr:peroxidase [Gammaproteobacteria bacterium]
SEVVARLRAAYASVDDIDLWVGGLAEDPVNGGHLGELFSRIVIRQFDDLRAGDRYWYQRTLSRSERRFVRRSTLANVIRRNTAIEREIGDELFRAGK